MRKMIFKNRFSIVTGIAIVLLILGYSIQQSLYAANPEHWNATQCRQHIKDDSSTTRTAAVKRLGELKDVTTMPDLLPLMRDADIETRRQAAWALGEIGDGWAVADLAITTTDPDTMTRRNSCEALGKMKDTRARNAITKALNDPDADTRVMAAKTLQTMHEK